MNLLRNALSGGRMVLISPFLLLLVKQRFVFLTFVLVTISSAQIEAQMVATPVISQASGTSYTQFNVTISEATPGATLYYTTNGTTPTSSSSRIASGGMLLISKSETLQVVAAKSGYTSSAIASAGYQVTGQAVGGYEHTVLLKSDGTVWTQGYNLNGQCGTGTSGNIVYVPTKLTSLSGIVEVAAGNSHSLALKNDGTVWAWGLNTNGQIGNGGTTQQTAPLQVSGLTNIIAISAGTSHSVALQSNGTVWAWGLNTNGQIGNGGTTQQLTPVQVSTPSNIIAISSGGFFNLALTSDGKVYVWGLNGNGQLGIGSQIQQSTPVQITSLSSISAISAGVSHSLALTSNGTLYAWGLNSSGQLGDGTTTQQLLPEVISLSGVVSLCAGQSFSMAQKSDGTVWSWGDNTYGEVGNNSLNSSKSPVQMIGVSNTVSIGAGYSHSLIIKSDGTLWGGGYDFFSQLGNGQSVITTPGQLIGSDQAVFSGVTSTSQGSVASHTLFVKSDGSVWSMGQNPYGELGDGTTSQRTAPLPVSGITGAVSVAAGQYHSLALLSNGTVLSWGLNASGQLGDNTQTNRALPVSVAGFPAGTVLKAVAAGNSHSLALDTTGAVWAWGLNTNGELGDATTTTRLEPVKVAGLSNVIQIVAGTNWSAALTSEGNIYAWGSNSSGQLGANSALAYLATPVEVVTSSGVLSGITSISAGSAFGLAIRGSDGTAWGWGANTSGQLGAAVATTSSVAVQLGFSTTGSMIFTAPVVLLTAGSATSLAQTSDGKSWSWGHGNYGELGDGTTASTRSTIQAFTGLSGITAFEAGSNQCLALKANGTVEVWGYQNFGQCGIGTNYSVPSVIPGFNFMASTPVPTVSITSPINNSTNLVQGQPISFTVNAAETGGTIANVQYYVNSTLVGQSTTTAFTFTYTPASFGIFNFTAIATDTAGQTSARSGIINAPIPLDSDTNGLGDWWELKYFGHLGNIPTSSPDGNGFTLLQDYQQGSDPTNYYSQNGEIIIPMFTVVSGSNQSSLAGSFAPQPLVVQVFSLNGGTPLVSAPVTFNVTSGGGLVSATSGGTNSTSLLVTTNSSGQAQVYYQQPSSTGISSTISASTGGQTVSFSETSLAQMVATPVISQASGTSYTQFNVTISEATPGATLYYTTNGTTPTSSSSRIASGGMLLISKSETLQVVAAKSGYTSSAIASAGYQVTGQAVGGYEHTVLLKSDGTVWTQGYNLNGQCGTGTSGNIVYVPTKLTSLSGIVEVAAGNSHSLALKNDGTVWAWGLNTNGQIGNGGTTQQTAPLQVSGLTNIIAISAGTSHSVALQSNGTVWAWGLNTNGQIGNGGTTQQLTPVQVSTPSNIIAISSGGFFNLALTSDGKVYVWGLNGNGQLGIGSQIQQSTPVQITSLSSISAISAGVSHSLALTSNGTLYAWGLNSSGQLGDGTTTQQLLPEVISLSGVVSLCAGQSFSMAQKSDGTVWSWGDNTYGEVGNNSLNSSKSPVQMIGVSNTVSIGAGYSHSLIIKSDGTLWGGGYDFFSQLGNGQSVITTPGQLIGSDQAVFSGVTSTSQGSVASHTLFVKSDGSVWSMGQNPYGELGDGTTSQRTAPLPVSGITGAVSVAAGQYHSLALLSNGTVLSWGLNASGQLGDNTQTNRALPVSVAGFPAGTVLKAVAAGNSHSLALDTTGAVWAWGLNTNGELGDATTTTRLEPVKVAGLSNVIQIVAGTNWSAALTSEGNIYAWGSNSSGQLGANSALAYLATPVEVVTSSGVLSGITSISAGSAFGLAIRGSDGTAWGWGANTSGQLGAAVATTSSVAVQLGFSTTGSMIFTAPVVLLTAGSATSLAQTSDGKSWSWGHGNYGELGDGTTASTRSTIQAFTGLSGITAFEAGSNQCLALKANGTVEVWGYQNFGQCGIGTNYSVPSVIPGFNFMASTPVPTVSITSPINNSTNLVQGQPISFTVNAAETGGTIANVQYYVNSTLVGQSTTTAFTFTYTPASFGIFNFTAIATDTAGQTSARSGIINAPIPLDSDTNGLGDWWELKYFGHLGNIPTSSPDGNGFTLLQDYQQGSDPTNYYSQNGHDITPVMTLISGNNQSALPGNALPSPLVVGLSYQGQSLNKAPVTFSVTAGGGMLSTDNLTWQAGPISIKTTSNGQGSIYFQAPSNSAIITVLANVSTGSTNVSQTFSLTSTPFASNPAPYSTNFSPSDGFILGLLNGQLGWTDLTALATIQTIVVPPGVGEAVSLPGNSLATRQFYTAKNTVSIQSNVFLSSTGIFEPAGIALPTGIASLVSYDPNQGVMAFNGNGSEGGSWMAAPSTILNNQWATLTIIENYTTKTWSLQVNGQTVLSGLGFKSNSVTRFSKFNLGNGTQSQTTFTGVSVSAQ